MNLGSEVWPQYVQPPVIPGHEFIGEVVKLGPGENFNLIREGTWVGFWLFWLWPSPTIYDQFYRLFGVFL